MKTIVEGWTDSLDRFSQLLMGTYNKTEDIISLSMVKDHGGISPEQAKRLVEFGFAVDFSNGKIDKQRLWLLDLIKVTDLYVNSLEGVNNNEVKRKLLINQLAQEKEKLIAFNKAGIMSKADMDAGLRLITDQLKKVQALKDQELHKNTNTNAPLVKDDKAKKKFEEDQAAFWRRIEELRKEASLYSLSEIEKDKAKEFDAYQKVLDDIEKAQKEGLIKGVEIDRAKQAAADHHYKKLREIDEKYMHKFNADTEQNLKEYNDFTNQQRQNEINDVMAQYDKLMVLAADDAQKQIELKQALDQKLAEIDKKYSVSPIGATPDMTEFDKYKDLVNKYSNHLGTIAAIDDNFAQVKANKIQKEQAAADAQTQNDLDREKRLLDMKIISQKTYDERVKSIEAQKQNRDRLAANKQMANQKNAARFSAALNFVEMESKTLAHYGLTPEAAIAMAVGAALEISKMAVINSQEIPPQYAGGGLHDPNGYVNSETMFSSSSGQPFIAGERGAEWIAPSWMLNEPVIANQIGILEAVRQRGRGFVSGGSTQTAPVPSFAGGGSTNTGISQSNAQLVAVISRLSEQIDRGIGVNYDLLTKTTKSIENAKNGSAVN